MLQQNKINVLFYLIAAFILLQISIKYNKCVLQQPDGLLQHLFGFIVHEIGAAIK